MELAKIYKIIQTNDNLKILWVFYESSKNVLYSAICNSFVVAALSYYAVVVKPKSGKIEQTPIAEPEWFVDSGEFCTTLRKEDVLFSRQKCNETDAL